MIRKAHRAGTGGAFRAGLRHMLNMCLLAIVLLAAGLSVSAPYLTPDPIGYSASSGGESGAPAARSHIQNEIARLELTLSCDDQCRSEGCKRASQVEKCCDLVCHTACAADAVEAGISPVGSESFRGLPEQSAARLPFDVERPPRA